MCSDFRWRGRRRGRGRPVIHQYSSIFKTIAPRHPSPERGGGGGGERGECRPPDSKRGTWPLYSFSLSLSLPPHEGRIWVCGAVSQLCREKIVPIVCATPNALFHWTDDRVCEGPSSYKSFSLLQWALVILIFLVRSPHVYTLYSL